MARMSKLPPPLNKGQGSRRPIVRLPLRAWPVHPVAAFSLIEVLVVLVIVSVLAVAVSISIASAGGERQLEREAERLQALLEHACRQAELGGREIGVRIDAKGYAFAMRGFTGWSSGPRQDELRAHAWVPGIRLELLRDGRPVSLAGGETDTPQLVCFSSGELSPFLLRMELGDVGTRYELSGDIQGVVALRHVEIRP